MPMSLHSNGVPETSESRDAVHWPDNIAHRSHVALRSMTAEEDSFGRFYSLLLVLLLRSVEQYGSLSAGIFDTHAFMYSVSHFLVMFGVSFAIGVIVGFLTALLTKFTHIRDYPTLETALFILMSYSTFLLAETVGFTGIVAVLFCGIIQAHYTYNNLSEESKVWTREFFEILNFLSENFVFAYIGVSTFTFQQHYWDVRFVLIALFACIVARAVNVYPLSAIINLCRSYGKSCKSDCFRGRSRARQSAETQSSVVDANSGQSSGYDVLKDSYRPSSDQDDESTKMFTADIPWNVQHMLFYSGLRGAMAFSLAIRNTSSTTRQMFFSTTIVVVMITVIIFGGLSTTMLAWLKIRVGVNSPQATEGSSYHDDNVLRPPRRHLGCCAYCWYRLDRQYIMPLFTNRGPPLTESVPWCCYPIAKLLTTTQQLNQPLDEQSSRPETRGDSPAVLILHDRNVGVKLDSESALDPKSYQYTPLIQMDGHETRELKAHDDSSADLSDVLNHAHPDPLDSTKVQGRFIHQDIA
ncbi:unnamed protein product [Calicophoron daubneyi]|uniref:Cation/H+ exchanger transmembrane domain-containing protein n=1 Tax=Calicophoron daubneyi TaxID=300641 RepID=A0AAV2TDR6_CALDB